MLHSNPYLKSTPLSHQWGTASFILKHKYIGDFSEMGTGKSLSALTAFAEMKRQDPLAVMLVVCPPGLANNWRAEIGKHTIFSVADTFAIDDSDIYIVSYTKLDKAEALFRLATFVVADEAHYLKNMDAKRTRFFHALMELYSPVYFDYATGTPLKNRVPEAYSMLRLWEYGPNLPKISDSYPSYYTFCCRFTNVRETPFGQKYEGMKNVDELRKYITPFTIRHPASVLALPELSETDVVVSYNDDPALAMAFERFTDKGVGAEISVKRDSAVATAKFTAEFIRYALEQGSGPVVVFSDHIKPLEIMALELSGFKVGIISGETPMAERQPLVDRLNGGKLDVLLGTFGAMSAGYNLTAANLLVVNDPPWVPGDYEQAKKRIHRKGQERPCRIVRVIGSKVVETIYRALTGKTKVITKVLE